MSQNIGIYYLYFRQKRHNAVTKMSYKKSYTVYLVIYKSSTSPTMTYIMNCWVLGGDGADSGSRLNL